ncbi:unnamed protein product [Didymodactylos carnosus]|uniref:Uncharacterized protein n=1 Tax=Didymodactylos carnosus TaxID=1234261 RepID=A0A814FA76_9BILA|nr:unnamed protein product [Didymodactylos carnosus]CAF3752696.1 unnamed protein product [Didymodactylos carnosus]
MVAATLQQLPPAYILQSWRREQPSQTDRLLLEQTFLIAPDTALPFSSLRRRIREVQEERAKPNVVVYYDPWSKEAFQVQTHDRTTTKFPRSHTVI